MDRGKIKTIYNKTMRLLYCLLPIKQIVIESLFSEEPIKSFHVVVAVRYLFVESYKNPEDVRFKLYKKAIHLNEQEEEKDLEHFRILVTSIENEGLKKSHPILMDKESNVIDGTHRLAAAVFLGKKSIYVRKIPRKLKPINAEERLKMFSLNSIEEKQVYESYNRFFYKLMEPEKQNEVSV